MLPSDKIHYFYIKISIVLGTCQALSNLFGMNNRQSLLSLKKLQRSN